MNSPISIALFLLNKDDTDNQSLAYLMYDMISNESYLLKPQPLAEQVFNSLHWSVQKLFNTAIKKIDNIQINRMIDFIFNLENQENVIDFFNTI